MNERMNRTKLNIGAYMLQPNARSERHIKEAADCGIDFIIGINDDKPTLDLFSKYGLGAIVSGIAPGWWGGYGQNAGMMAVSNPIEKYEEAAKIFADHPAIWGIDAGDEPSALDFGHWGKVASLVDKLFPHQFAYLNIYPSYAAVAKNSEEEVCAQLGTDTYEEYISQYTEKVPTDYISYDYYVYSHQTRKIPCAYENLRVVANACRRAKRSMWVVLEANSISEDGYLSENKLRHQAFTAMTFGTEVITWACYTAGWWFNNVLDGKGGKTEQYDKLRKVNGEIAEMGMLYMKYRCLSSHFVGLFIDPEFERSVKQMPEEKFDAGVFSGVHAGHGEAFIAGHMVERCGAGEALMLADAGDPYDEAPASSYPVFFRCGASCVRALRNGEEIPVKCEKNGLYSVEMHSCAGILITAN